MGQIEDLAQLHFLTVLGGFHANGQDKSLPKGTQTLLLLGPSGPEFWPHVTAAPEWVLADPIDRWSRRVIGGMACDLGAKAVFPFSGPPWHPFFDWALRCGTFYQSPTQLLVHPAQGLMVSLRGALALSLRIDLPGASPDPCLGCAQPCLNHCPAQAIRPGDYDIGGCRAWLAADLAKNGETKCLKMGCLARRACPISINYGRMDEQSAWHMRNFLT